MGQDGDAPDHDGDLNEAIRHYGEGRLPQAKEICRKVLAADPDQPTALNMLGAIAYAAGESERAVELVSRAIAVKPDYAEAHNNLGNLLRALGRLAEAEESYLLALDLKPEFADAHNNLGAALFTLGRLEDAVASYRRAIALSPGLAEAHNNLGGALHELGRWNEAVADYRRAIAIKPDYAEAHSNLGRTLKELGRLDEAISSFQKALALKPDFAEALSNLGNALRKLGKPDEAVASFHKALAINPDFAEAHCNLGVALEGLGKLDEAVASFHKVLAINPDNAEAWNNFKLAAKALHFSQAQKKERDDFYKTGLCHAARATADFAILENYLDSFKPHESDESFRKAMAALPRAIDEEVTVNERAHDPASPPQRPEKLVALLHFGRSGTGLLHSLIDGHPEISTLPSIYLRGFFNAGVWDKISAKGWRGLPELFADEFAVLFDANSSKTTPGMTKKDLPFLGRNEGMANVGENRNEALSLDRDKFCSEALRLMKGLDKVDPRSFFLVVHAAFEKVMETKTKKHTVFYHIHNPNDFARLNFLRYAPDARLVMMVREPIQSCESWVRIHFNKNDYDNVIHRMIGMLFAIDQVAFRMRESVGVRMEDLKTRPEATLRNLCAWLGVEDAPSLYETTAQGKKWWGDPSSPDYDENKAMSPFGGASINRPVGSVFSEKDQFVLRTLFYPFSVRFGYRKPAPVEFEKNLEEIRPLLDDMLDFEKEMAERSNIDHARFKRNGVYLLFRASLMDRWEVLDELGDYPHMLSPLAGCFAWESGPRQAATPT